jgi:uroporphyrinogen III methyltransferase/synthase
MPIGLRAGRVEVNNMVGAGTVYLVGAGPGDPGLLTLRGRDCLARADLVLYDGLVNPLLLQHVRGTAERTSRACGADGRRLNQDEINARLIAAARSGLTVVRLKGGDPFIFGRGAEEAQALQDAGIPYEIVPGVTAAVAAGAYAGIPFTHREDASAVAFVTGHEDPRKQEPALDWHVLAAFPGTLVFYMGLHRLRSIIDSLLQSGKPANTPAAVICQASTPHQRTVTATLSTLADAVEAAALSPPSLIVIGETVRHHGGIDWFERRPLFGLRVGITRPACQAGATVERCLELGAEPVLMPTIEIRPPADWTSVDRAIGRLDEFDWLVFTSVNGVDSFFQRMWDLGHDARMLSAQRIAVIGEATSQALTAWKLRANLVPDSFRAEALAAALKAQVAGRRVLWVRASRGRDVLSNELSVAGASVEEVVAYQNLDCDSLPSAALVTLEEGRLDWIGLSSPSIARNLSRLLTPSARNQIGRATRLAAISPVTAEAAQEVGLPVHAVANQYTWDGLFDSIVQASSGGRS